MHIVFVMSIGLSAALMLSAALHANVLEALKPVDVNPGDLLEQTIDIDRSSGIRTELTLLSPPDGAKLIVNTSGQLTLQWKTGMDLPKQTQLSIQATDIDTQTVVGTRILQVRNSRKFIAEKASISLNPIPNQIVSNGRMISVMMSAVSSDESQPVISMDRVPANASFKENRGGGYIFLWKTGDRDQGEHVFRVTASHPSDSKATVTTLMTVFVGDPSKRKTVPAPIE